MPLFRILCIFNLLSLALTAQLHVLTANYGNERTSANLQETILTPENVTPETFGKLGSFPVDGAIYGQPLYVQRAVIGGIARNVLYVATMHNTVYAFDADAPKVTIPLWAVNLGRAVPAEMNESEDTAPETGILSTPVIDLARNAIYVVAETWEKDSSGKQAAVFRLHALDLSDGREKLGSPGEIKAEVEGGGGASVNGKVTFDPLQHLQRPGLLLLHNNIYIAFGSHTDSWPYHGWIFAYDASDVKQQVAVLNTTPDGDYGSVWQSGRGLAADAEGNIYIGTANGDYDGETNFGESFLKLSPTLKVIDWYTPPDWNFLSDYDYDIGSLGPVLLPGTELMLGGDKLGQLYLIERKNMGRLDPAAAPSPRAFQASQYGGIFTTAVWNSELGMLVYVVEEGESTNMFKIVDGKFLPKPISTIGVSSDLAYQGMAISANGGKAGTGILWMTTGSHDEDGIPGTIFAFDASDLTRELWNSDIDAKRDELGGFAKFVSPTVANGRVYVPTFSNQLAIYGLLPGPAASAASVR